jgi:hypothetical protein
MVKIINKEKINKINVKNFKMTQKSTHKNIIRYQYFQTKNLSQIISN